MVSITIKQLADGWIGYIKYGNVNTYAVTGTIGNVLKNIELEINGVWYL